MSDTGERRKELKRLYHDVFDELCSLLYRLDPEIIASAFDNPHLDEYSLEVGTILPRLTRAHSLDEAKEIIRQEFHYWFGESSLIDQSLDQVAREVWQTFERIWHLQEASGPPQGQL